MRVLATTPTVRDPAAAASARTIISPQDPASECCVNIEPPIPALWLNKNRDSASEERKGENEAVRSPLTSFSVGEEPVPDHIRASKGSKNGAKLQSWHLYRPNRRTESRQAACPRTGKTLEARIVPPAEVPLGEWSAG